MFGNTGYRFALVAHSAEVANCVRRVARYDDYDIDYTVATFDATVPAAEEYLHSGYDVVLCHGGSGRSIVRAIGNSVVAIDRTDMDVIKTLRQASQLSDHIALATYQEENHDIEVMADLLNIRIHHITYATWNELFLGVKHAYDQGIRVLVGGGISKQSMEDLGGTGFVIAPNPHSIQVALEQAKSIARQKRIENARRTDLVAIFKHLQEGVVCIDNAGTVIFSNQKASKLLKLPPSSGMDGLRPFYDGLMLTNVLADATPRYDSIKDIGGEQFVVTTIPLTVHPGMLGAVVFFRDVPSLQHLNRKISEELFVKGFVARSMLDDIKGKSGSIQDMKQKIVRFAATGATVLVSGETGTGKELVAHSLHAESARSDKAFVAVNCASLPENLMESELFGYEDGAFTGAKRGGKLGLFEMANGGTIFLDEVGEISHEMQLRLLRVLEAKEIMRVGDSRIRPVDVRVICASHKPLLDLVGAGKFRLDLYYRLSTLKIAVPPLRERLEDIPLLLEKLLQQYAKPATVLSPNMLDAMRCHQWPGNIRELLAVIETYLILLGGTMPDEPLFAEVFRENTAGARSQPREHAGFDPGLSLRGNLECAKTSIIQQTVQLYNGDKKAAAKHLGISYTTLWRALQDNGHRESTPDLRQDDARICQAG